MTHDFLQECKCECECECEQGPEFRIGRGDGWMRVRMGNGGWGSWDEGGDEGGGGRVRGIWDVIDFFLFFFFFFFPRKLALLVFWVVCFF